MSLNRIQPYALAMPWKAEPLQRAGLDDSISILGHLLARGDIKNTEKAEEALNFLKALKSRDESASDTHAEARDKGRNQALSYDSSQPLIHKSLRIRYEGMKRKRRESEEYRIPVDSEKFILYVPRKGVLSLVNKAFIESRKSHPLVQGMMSLIAAQPCIPTLKRMFSSDNIGFDITRRCNLNCTYCYAHSIRSNETLPWSTAKIAIDHRLEDCGDTFNITFLGGGEPMLAFKEVRRIYDYCREECERRAITLTCDIVSNGILNETIIEWLHSNPVNLVVSLDGPPEIQNTQRPLCNGGDSYQFVAKTVKRLNQLAIPYTIRVTLTEKTVEKMPSIMDHFHQLEASRVVLEPCSDIGDAQTEAKPPDLRVFTKNYLDCLELAEEYNMVLAGKITSLTLRNTHCGACGSNFIVTVDGLITACPEVLDQNSIGADIFIYGRINGSHIEIDSEKLSCLRQRVAHRMHACNRCFAKWSCAGDCLIRSLRHTGSIYVPYKPLCDSNRTVLKQTLLRLLDNARKDLDVEEMNLGWVTEL